MSRSLKFLNNMKLSIIISTWNTADITLRCVQSVIKYLKKVSYEIIVVDNGSIDNTKLVLSKIKKVKYIQNSSNLGFSKANNIGAKNGVGDYLLFLNSDILLIDNSIIFMLEHLQNHPNIGVIGPTFINLDGSPQASVFPPQTPINAFKEYWLNIKSSYSKYLPNTDKPLEVYSISGGCLLISKILFTKIGGWNEKYHFYYEDLDLCREIHCYQKKVIYFPGTQVVHHHGASGSKLADSSNQWRRLVPSSILYHGYLKHMLINCLIWSGQKIIK